MSEIKIKNKLSDEELLEKIKEKKKKKDDYFNKLIECKSCNEKVNCLADTCPNCGWKVISNQKAIQGFVAMTIIGSIVYWLYNGGFLTLFEMAFTSNFK